MENQPKPAKKRRVPRRFLVGVVIFALLVGTASYLWLVNNNAPQTITEISQLSNQTEAVQGDFTLSEVNIANTGAKITATANLKYNGAEPTNARLTFTLINTASGQLQGRKYLNLENIKPGEQRPVEASIVGDFNRSNSYKIEVEKN
jgi:hypothetical protein